MRVVVITAPQPVVSLNDAKVRLKPEDGDDDLIKALIDAATGSIDGPSGWLGRAIGRQTLEARLDAFMAPSLPFPPVHEITSIKYLDQDGVEQTLATSEYEVMGDCVLPAFRKAWPTLAYRREAVRVRYVAGYETVPAPIVTAILLMVGDLYATRETFGLGTMSEVPMSLSVQSLLQPFRVYR